MNSNFRSTLTSTATCTILFLHLSGCGPLTDPSSDLASSFTSLNWYLQCPSNPVSAPSGDGKNVVLNGSGPHKLAREDLVGTPVTFNGRLCAPRSYNRDVVVAVDGSGSMSWNDPRVGDSCQRLQALNTLLDGLPAQSAMAVFGFSNTYDFAVTQYYQSKAALFADLIQSYNAAHNVTNGKIADVVCWLGGGASDFNLAMQKGKELLKLGRSGGASKELYLVSDGDRGGIAATVAVALADELKTAGVAIGTETTRVAIGAAVIPGDPDALLGLLASRDRTGQILKLPASRAADLGRAGADHVRNRWESGKLEFRPINSGAWTSVDAVIAPAGFDFSTPKIEFEIDGRQSGIELKFGYADTHSNKINLTGRLEWTD